MRGEKMTKTLLGTRKSSSTQLQAFGALLYCANGGQGAICVSMSQFKR